MSEFLGRFLRDCKAGVAPILGLTIIPLMTIVGAGVDYSRANSVKASMQGALDSAALTLAKAVTGPNDPNMQPDKVTAFFKANFNHPEAQNVHATATYDPVQGGHTVTVNASAAVNTNFLRLIDYPQLQISSNTIVTWGVGKLRVALVLDNTGSMCEPNSQPCPNPSSNTKIASLKTASHNLLTQLKSAAKNDGDVLVSIIPFGKDVNAHNADASNYTQTWIDWTDWEDEPPYIKTNKPSNWDQIGPGSSCPFTNSSQGFQCTVNPTNGSSTASKIPSSGSFSGYICPSIDNGNKVAAKSSVYYNGCYNSVQASQVVASGSGASCGSTSNCSCSGSGSHKTCTRTYYNHTWIKNAHSTWNGCVTDRDQNFDTLNTAPSAGSTLFHAEQYSSCPTSLIPMSYDWTKLNSKIDAMTPAGNTNQAIGLAWGWQSLAQTAPLNAPALDPNYQYQQVIILLSDGLNTQDRWYNSASPIDNRQQIACTNAKNAGITIYTVLVMSGDSTVLKNCASDASKYYALTDANSIITTFNTIGTNLAKLHLSK